MSGSVFFVLDNTKVLKPDGVLLELLKKSEQIRCSVLFLHDFLGTKLIWHDGLTWIYKRDAVNL